MVQLKAPSSIVGNDEARNLHQEARNEVVSASARLYLVILVDLITFAARVSRGLVAYGLACSHPYGTYSSNATTLLFAHPDSGSGILLDILIVLMPIRSSIRTTSSRVRFSPRIAATQTTESSSTATDRRFLDSSKTTSASRISLSATGFKEKASNAIPTFLHAAKQHRVRDDSTGSHVCYMTPVDRETDTIVL